MDGANLNHLSRALAFVLITFLLNLAAVLFMGSPSRGPEGGFGIVRVVPVCPQNKFLAAGRGLRKREPSADTRSSDRRWRRPRPSVPPGQT
jgi:hypothetical protein